MKKNRLLSIVAAGVLLGTSTLMAQPISECVSGQIYTSGSCTIPSGVTQVTLESWGGGGGGATQDGTFGGGGGGGGYCKYEGPLTNNTLTFSNGLGGIGGEGVAPNDGGVGGTTSISFNAGNWDYDLKASGGTGGTVDMGGIGGSCEGLELGGVTDGNGGFGSVLGGGGASGSPFGNGGDGDGDFGADCASGATDGIDCGIGDDAPGASATSPGGGAGGNNINYGSGGDGGNGQVRISWAVANTATTFSTLTEVTTTDKANPVAPFTGITLTDADSTAFTATLSLDTAAKGTLSTTSIASGDLATVQSAIQAITFTPTENRVAVGSTETSTITLTVTADGVNGTTTNTVVTTSMNDAPTIDTTFNDIVLQEDNGTTNYELNVSDIEGEDLNITVESNNTSILNVTPNWNGLLNQGQYSEVTQDFNLTTQPNANGIVNITVRLNDGELSDIKTFTVTVNAVNDKPVFESLSNIVVYKNTLLKTLEIPVDDIDSNITYAATYSNAELLQDINFTNNSMTISITNELSGTSDINVTVSDEEYNVSKVFKFQVIALNENDDLKTGGDVEVDENETIIVTFTDDNITIKAPTVADANGTISHEINFNGVIVQATSEINGSKTELTADGVHTFYEDIVANIKAETNATITGQATHSLDVNGTKTIAKSEFLGAKTTMKDVNGSIEIVTSLTVNSNTTVSVKAKEDGTAEHTVTYSGVATKATSTVKGASTTIKTDGVVETAAPTEIVDEIIGAATWVFEAVAMTGTDGTTLTTFRKRKEGTTEVQSLKSTFKTAYDIGSSVEIKVINNKTYFETTAPLSTTLIVE